MKIWPGITKGQKALGCQIPDTPESPKIRQNDVLQVADSIPQTCNSFFIKKNILARGNTKNASMVNVVDFGMSGMENLSRQHVLDRFTDLPICLTELYSYVLCLVSKILPIHENFDICLKYSIQCIYLEEGRRKGWESVV